MDRTSDAVATWAWGLRRYAWIVALFVIGVGILVPVAQSRSADVYQAQAQVGPTKPLILQNLDPLPRFAQSVFTNGAVARDVRQLLGLTGGASVIPGTVQLTTAQDNPVMVIDGKGSSPATAAVVADQAAATFVVELNRYTDSVGTFAVQHAAVAPAKPVPKLVGGYLALVVGVLAGLVAGCGLVGLILVLRRPVVGAASAEATTGLPVLGSVPLPRKGPPDGNALVGISALSRRLLRGGHDVVYVTGYAQSEVDRVATAIGEFLANARSPRRPRPPKPGTGDAASSPSEQSTPEIVALDASSIELWIETPDEHALTLLLVPEGIRAKSLHKLTEQQVSGGAAAVALVTLHRQRIRFASKRSREATLASQPG